MEKNQKNYSDRDWEKVLDFFKKRFTAGETPAWDTILFLIGIQELGQGIRSFTKDEKINLMHVGTCAVLEPLGYYELIKHDEEGWPHYQQKKSLPSTENRDYDQLMKKAVITYFKRNGLID